MLEDAERNVQRGIRSLKVKLWHHSDADVDLVRDIRHAVGGDVNIYADANYSYDEDEARTLLPKLVRYNVTMIEDPCKISAERLALLQRDLPIRILGEIPIDSLSAAQHYVELQAIGAISLHVGRTGITETLEIAALAAEAALPAVVGTDLEGGHWNPRARAHAGR